jgi:hypothetical protein
MHPLLALALFGILCVAVGFALGRWWAEQPAPPPQPKPESSTTTVTYIRPMTDEHLPDGEYEVEEIGYPHDTSAVVGDTPVIYENVWMLFLRHLETGKLYYFRMFRNHFTGTQQLVTHTRMIVSHATGRLTARRIGAAEMP